MTMTEERTLAAELGRVAVLDDDEDIAKAVTFELQDLGMDAVVGNLDDLVDFDSAVAWVRDSADCLVSDVQLSNMFPGIAYNGAELVAKLVRDFRMPCVLTTGFVADVGMIVRPHRADIPVLMGRDETEEPDALLAGLRRCRAEILGGRGPERRTRRVPLFVEKVSTLDHRLAIDARVGSWPQSIPMRFPASMLDSALSESDRAGDLIGKVFFACVNIAAERESDLFFEAPESAIIDPAAVDLHFEDR